MLKKLTAVLAVLLAALMLCGAALPNGWYNEDGTDVPLRFADMPYTRPDPEAMRVLADRLTDVLANAGGYRRAVELLDQLFTDYYSANTMYTIADIRSCQDLTNEYWAAEYGACMSALTQINQIMEDVYLACGASPYGERLEREYFGEGFMAEYGENAESMLSEKYVALIEQENELLMAYREAVASPTVQVNGAEVPMSDVMYDIWDEQEYNALLDAYYEKYNPILGELYLRLMEVRKAQAAELGYSGYAEMMFDIGFDRDFSVEDGRAFLESVKTHILPVYARRMDSDRQYDLMEGYVSEDQLYGVLETVANGLGGEIKQAYDFMRAHELSDLAMSDVKADMSYQTYLDDYDAPFLFANPYGDRTDVVTVTHEFGHYAEAYMSYGAYRSIDLAEVFSQAMQYLSLNKLRGVLGEQGTNELRLLNLYDTLDTLAWQSAYAEFEDRAYSMPEPTVEKLNALMEDIGREYGLNADNDPGFKFWWVDVPHLFEQPFYVISYPVSACCALEIYEHELKDGSGLKDYLRLVDSEEIGIIGAAKGAGLQNPVTDERVRDVADFMDRQLAADFPNRQLAA